MSKWNFSIERDRDREIYRLSSLLKKPQVNKKSQNRKIERNEKIEKKKIRLNKMAETV